MPKTKEELDKDQQIFKDSLIKQLSGE